MKAETDNGILIKLMQATDLQWERDKAIQKIN